MDIAQHKDNVIMQSKLYAWFNCLISALFFLYQFMQMNFIDAISQPLMTAFNINTTQLGFLGSSYLLVWAARNTNSMFNVKSVMAACNISRTLGLLMIGFVVIG